MSPLKASISVLPKEIIKIIVTESVKSVDFQTLMNIKSVSTYFEQIVLELKNAPEVKKAYVASLLIKMKTMIDQGPNVAEEEIKKFWDMAFDIHSTILSNDLEASLPVIDGSNADGLFGLAIGYISNSQDPLLNGKDDPLAIKGIELMVLASQKGSDIAKSYLQHSLKESYLTDEYRKIMNKVQ